MYQRNILEEVDRIAIVKAAFRNGGEHRRQRDRSQLFTAIKRKRAYRDDAVRQMDILRRAAAESGIWEKRPGEYGNM